MALQVGELFAMIGADSSGFDGAVASVGPSLKGAQGDIVKVGAGISKALIGVMAAGVAAVGAACVAGIMKVDDMKGALNGLQAQTGATDAEMGGFKDSLNSIYSQNFGEDYTDIADSMALIEQQTGLAGKALEEATINAIAMRDTFGMEVPESIRAVDMMMKQFGISSDEAYNLVAQGAQNGLDKNQNLLDSVNEYSVHFKKLGFDSEEMFNMFSNGAETGVFDIDKLGDAMKEFGIRSTDGSKASMEAFTALGFNADDMMGKFNAGGEIAKEAFDEVTAALANTTDKTVQTSAGVGLFGTMFEDMGVDAVVAMGNVNGSIDKTKSNLEGIKEVKYNTIGEAWSGIGRILETSILIPIGEKLIPKLQEMTQVFMDNLPAIQEAAQTAFDAISTAISWVVENFDILAPILATVVAGFLAFQTFSFIAGVMAAISAATTGVSIAQAALNAVMALNPFVLVATAIAALVAGFIVLYATNEDFRTFIQGCWDDISKIFSDAFNWIQTTAEKVFEGLQAFWDKWGGDITKVFNQYMDLFKSIFKLAFDYIKDVFKIFSAAFRGDWAGCWDAVKTLFVNLWDNLKKVFSNYASILGSAFSALKSTISAVWNALWTGISSFFVNIWNNIQSAFTSGVTKVKTSANELATGVKNAIMGLPSAASDVARNFISGLSNGITNGISNVVSSIKDMASRAVKAAKDALGIRSPSTVMEAIGVFTGKGMIKGVESTKDDIDNIMKDLVDTSALEVKIPKASIDGITGSVENAGLGLGNSYKTEYYVTINASVRNDNDITKISRGLQRVVDGSNRAAGEVS